MQYYLLRNYPVVSVDARRSKNHQIDGLSHRSLYMWATPPLTMRSIPTEDERAICEYCDDRIDEEDHCDGSLIAGATLCYDCLEDWQKDNTCKCVDCRDCIYCDAELEDDEECQCDGAKEQRKMITKYNEYLLAFQRIEEQLGE